jgi:hypothetical protein
MSADDQISHKVTTLGVQYGHIVETLAEIKQMISGMHEKFVSQDKHDYKMLALDVRVAAVEAMVLTINKARDEEAKNGGMLGWWRNVTQTFQGFIVIGAVIGLVVTLGIRIAGQK